LASRGLASQNNGDTSSGFYQFSVGVIDRVMVQGVMHVKTRSTAESHLASVRLEERFKADDEFPNRWRHVADQPEDWITYSGLAGYAKATRLEGQGDAILVECHAILHEPSEWFHGPNLLSSKLPLLTQDAVRKFRRKLAKQD
jgi:hypothetical protein